MPARLSLVLVLAVLAAGNPEARGQAAPAAEPPAQISGESIAQTQAAASQPAAPGPVRIVPFPRNGTLIRNTAAPAGAHLTYWGGPVISQVHVVAVFWGPNVNTAIT
ncbi:MAG TPA: hypothetical protein VLT16_05400, partial [Candidatus Limnocylindrales bacterium]|nr:hypothetical protein [Candidatus Limnocylindrales bacterium]